jgi:hypothetical protein
MDSGKVLAQVRPQLRDVLHAEAPGPSRGDQARIFDAFVGTWECDYTHFNDDASVKERYRGHLTFGWILEGQALQDVWTGDTGDGRGERQVGTSIRFYDPTADRWTVVWILPESSTVVSVSGGKVGDRIVLEGESEDGSRRRWSFNDIGEHSFVWRGERSTDRGRTWALLAEYAMTRRP